MVFNGPWDWGEAFQSMSGFSYRPDVDGLRTLAVIPVILFHAGASWLPGGFVGVDVFFVISGYLISSIIIRDVQEGKFSFLHFYERRVRRIIPALLVVLAFSVSLFQVIALPDQSKKAAESAMAALLSVSNFYFWHSSGYFSPAAELMPLLHTWSLGVEEQFYFLFPILLIMIFRWRLPIRATLSAAAILSFGVGLWLSVNKPSFAYYLLPARAWELLVGVVLATGAIPRIRGSLLGEAVPLIGIVMILSSLFLVGSDSVFPGWIALIPCLGAALVIHSDGQSWIARHVLASRPMVFIGLLSYSLYLWHFPVFAAIRTVTANLHLEMTVAVAAIAATFLLAWLSWRHVEMPFRNHRRMAAGRMFLLLGAGVASVALIAGVSIAMSGFPARLPQAAQAALMAAGDIDPMRTPCLGVHDQAACRFGSSSAEITYALIGDSHAAAIRPAIEASSIMGGETGTLFWAGACPLLDGAELRGHPERANCNQFKRAVWAEIESHPAIRTVVLAGRWPFQMTGSLPESGGSYRVFLVDQETVTPSIEESARVFRRSMMPTLDRLSSRGIRVIVIGSTPEPGFDVPHTVAMARYVGINEPPGIARRSVEQRAALADSILAGIVDGRHDVALISIWEKFCDSQWCRIEHAGIPIYSDDDHLSFNGALDFAAHAIAAGN